jgi:predicted adenylyl cyclase CyaB
MQYMNVEIKARCFHPEKVEAFLFAHNASFKGVDLQKDTYFKTADGRLKLRQGNIENNLIFYRRNDQKGPKQSDFYIAPVANASALETLLIAALGVTVVVEKKRKIFFLDNIKIHLDEVPGFGSFIEIEAGNISRPDLSKEELYRQCTALMKRLDIRNEDLVENSYSDMLGLQ